MWIRQAQGIEIDAAITLARNFDFEVTFPIIDRFGVGGLGFAFDVGVVSFSIGLTAQLDGGVHMSSPNGFSISAKYSASREQRVGFSYDGAGYSQINDFSPLVTSSTQNFGQESLLLQFDLYPELDFGLQGYFLSVLGESFQLVVR